MRGRECFTHTSLVSSTLMLLGACCHRATGLHMSPGWELCLLRRALPLCLRQLRPAPPPPALEMRGSLALSVGVFCPWVCVLCRGPPWVLPPLQPLNTLCQGSRSLSVCVSSCGHPPPQPPAPWPPTHTGHVQPSTVHHVDPAPWLRVAQGVISGSWKLTHTRPMITWG